jgi:hypothetical protein
MCYICSAGSETIADGLKPLTMSHIARTNSFKIMGRYKIINPGIRPMISNKFTTTNKTAAITPHTEIQRGTRFDRYNR